MVARGMGRVEDEAGMYTALRRTAQISLTLREPPPEHVLKAISAADEFGAWLEEAEFVAVLYELAAESQFEDG